jgi:Tfp pilus assembly PilM family ATPase
VSPYPKARGLYLDLGYNSLKVLLHGRGLEIPLERSPGGKYDTESKETVTRQLQGFLGSSRGVRRAVCAVPARGVSLRSLTIPRASKEETRKLLALQVEKEFPLPPEEIAWGYVAEDEAPGAGNGARKDAGSLQEVAILAVRRRLLAEYAALLEGCGVRATFQLGALATSAVCPAAGGNGSVLDIGRTHSELLVLEDGKARLLRSFSWGGESVTQAIGEALKIGRDEAEELKRAWKVSADEKAGSGPALSAAIATAVNDLLRLIQEAWPPRSSGNGARPPSMLFLAGGGSQLPGLDEKVARSLGEGVTCKVLKLERAPGLSSATLGLALDEGRRASTGRRDPGGGGFSWQASLPSRLWACGMVLPSGGSRTSRRASSPRKSFAMLFRGSTPSWPFSNTSMKASSLAWKRCLSLRRRLRREPP